MAVVGTGEDAVDEKVMLRAGAEDAGSRVDRFLSDRLPEMTRSAIQRLLQEGHVEAHGAARAVKNYRLREGDCFTVTIPEPVVLDVSPQDIPLDIVYEDSHLIVVNKPQGMVVHPAPGSPDQTLVNALMYHCGSELSSINGIIRPGIVHRIDKDTSGLLVAAKSDAAHRGLADQFAEHSIRRAYRAVAYHHFREEKGTVDAPIGRSRKDRLRMAVTSPEEGRRAVTHYRVLASANGFSHIQCRLETGRTHQIRVHMSYIGHPLLGDPVYGPRRPAFGIQQQVLHAEELGFIHPVTGEEMLFRSPLPEHFRIALRKTGLLELQE